MSNVQTPAHSQSAQVVTTPVVSCDGGGGPLGHPKVFLTFNHSSELTCPYCSQVFQLAAGAKTGHGH